jgi:NADH:ubiquinone oxidoreductase subunit 5 (subunit L)/multisubunit Na+/H+ antiporter MnhA subunit
MIKKYIKNLFKLSFFIALFITLSNLIYRLFIVNDIVYVNSFKNNSKVFLYSQLMYFFALFVISFFVLYYIRLFIRFIRNKNKNKENKKNDI